MFKFDVYEAAFSLEERQDQDYVMNRHFLFSPVRKERECNW